MKALSAVKKAERYLGVSVVKDGQRYNFEYDGKICSFRENSDGSASNFHVRNKGDVSCLQSDYFAGYFLKNMTQLLHACKDPEPKYPPGSLVGVKDTKRARRDGIFGKTGLVVDVTKYGCYHIQWVGDEHISVYHYERDLCLQDAA